MPLTSPIMPYDPTWPQQYAAEAARLKPIFNSALIGIHHVGSTAVPELAAKPEIDVLAVVRVRQQAGRLEPIIASECTFACGHPLLRRPVGPVAASNPEG